MITIQSFSVALYFDPQDEVNAIRNALLTTPQMLRNWRMLYHIPAVTTSGSMEKIPSVHYTNFAREKLLIHTHMTTLLLCTLVIYFVTAPF